MNQSDRTIRLQNKSFGNLSLNLQQFRAPASPGLRRGLLLTPILIVSGKYFDVCKGLGVSFDEAHAIVQRSPEVKAFVASNILSIIEFPPPIVDVPEPIKAAPPPPPPPPPPEPAASAPTPAASAPTPAPAAEPEIVAVVAPDAPASAELAPAPEPESIPVDFELPELLHAPIHDVPLADSGEPSVVEDTAIVATEDLPPPVVVTAPAFVAAPVMTAPVEAVIEEAEEPSMEWPDARLRLYAKSKGIDVSSKKSKTAVLRAIRNAGG
jgi:hypothetical protein